MLAALVLASGLFTTLDFGARTEFRLRETEGVTPGSAVFALDFTTVPYARFETKTRHFDFKVGYAASVTQADLEYGFAAGPQLFQQADVSAWYYSKHWVVGAGQAGGFGDMNFSYLTPFTVTAGQPPSGPPPVQLIPCTDLAHCAQEVVSFGTSATAIAARYTYRKTTFSISPSYSISGGLDPASKALVPIVTVPRLDFALEYRIARRDVLMTEGDATVADSSQRARNAATGGPPLTLNDPDPPLCSPSEQWIGLRETWRHRLSRRVALELSAGATVARATTNDVDDNAHSNPAKPYGITPYPVVRALLGYALENPDPDRPALHPVLTDPPKPSAYVYARLGPVVDTHYGFVDPRLEIGGAALKRLDEKYSMQAHVAFVRSVPPTPLDATYLAGSIDLLRRIDKYRLEAGGGFRAAYQQDPISGTFYVLSLYLTFVWHEPQIRL